MGGGALAHAFTPSSYGEAGGDPDGDKIFAIVGHERDDSCNLWVYKVDWKQGGQGWMPVSTLSRSMRGGLVGEYHS